MGMTGRGWQGHWAWRREFFLARAVLKTDPSQPRGLLATRKTKLCRRHPMREARQRNQRQPHMHWNDSCIGKDSAKSLGWIFESHLGIREVMALALLRTRDHGISS